MSDPSPVFWETLPAVLPGIILDCQCKQVSRVVTSLHSDAIDQGLAPLDLMGPGRALNGPSLVSSWKCIEYW